MHSTAHKITEHFNAAAIRYDGQAALQARVAQQLVAQSQLQSPNNILDIGCGTGFVSAALQQQYPHTHLTALDSAALMLQQARQKVPSLHLIHGDAATIDLPQKFDAVFSSMMLHWLPDPLKCLDRWRKWLKPNGKLCVALLTEGSFQEWRDLCATHHGQDGLWPMPKNDFAHKAGYQTKQEAIQIPFASAHEFLQRLKTTGAATPRTDHKPMAATTMRKLLRIAPQPFNVTYQVLYIETSPQGNS